MSEAVDLAAPSTSSLERIPLRRLLLSVSGLAVLVLAWQLALRNGHSLLPRPWQVVRALGELAASGILFKDIVASLFRVTWGYVTAVLLAVPVGLCLGWWRRGERAFSPLVQLFRPISPLAWIPIAILWCGVSDLAAIFIIFIAVFWPVVLSTMNSVRNVPLVHLQAARNFGLSPAQVIWRVVLPATLGQLMVGLRLALGIAWLVDVAAEMIAVTSGLGFLIIDSRNAGDRYDRVVAGMVVIGLVGFGLDTLMRALEARLMPYAPAQARPLAQAVNARRFKR